VLLEVESGVIGPHGDPHGCCPLGFLRAPVCGSRVSRPRRTSTPSRCPSAIGAQWRSRLYRDPLVVRHARQANHPHPFRGRARRSPL